MSEKWRACKECKAWLPEGCRCPCCEPQDEAMSAFTKSEIDEFLDRKHVFATKEEKSSSLAILSATAGYSPECVEACIAAVEAEKKWREVRGSLKFRDEWHDAADESEITMQAALALLPKRCDR